MNYYKKTLKRKTDTSIMFLILVFIHIFNGSFNNNFLNSVTKNDELGQERQV